VFDRLSSGTPGRSVACALLGQAGVLCALVALCLLVRRWIDVEELRSCTAAAGPAVPVAWALLAGILSAALVPGPLLGTASGALCGPVLGFAVNLAAMLLSASIASSVGRITAGRGLGGMVPAGRRAAVAAFRETYGAAAVVIQRLTPVLPDAPSSYAFGACGLRFRQILLGTLVGSPPWALIYALLGSGTADLTGTAVLVPVGLFVAANAAGFALARRVRDRGGHGGSRS